MSPSVHHGWPVGRGLNEKPSSGSDKRLWVSASPRLYVVCILQIVHHPCRSECPSKALSIPRPVWLLRPSSVRKLQVPTSTLSLCRHFKTAAVGVRNAMAKLENHILKGQLI